jgi:uncharacterized protein (DUF3820 family)
MECQSQSNSQERQMESTVMTFGKYQHKPINEVPYEYLHWCAKQDWCPVYIAVELDRRGAKYIEIPVKTRRKYKQHMKNTGQWEWKEAKASGTVSVGEHYEAMREQWELAGGDATQCPFGDEYTGPYLCWEGSEPVIICTSTEVCYED